MQVAKNGVSVQRVMLSMCSTPYKNCRSRKCALYAMCMKVCALVSGGKLQKPCSCTSCGQVVCAQLLCFVAEPASVLHDVLTVQA